MTDPEVAKCPFSYYAAMRREEPMHLDPGTGLYWISRHEDVVRAAVDTKSFSSSSPVILKWTFQPRAQALWDAAGMRTLHTLVTSDPPEHDDYRNLAMNLFTQKKVDELTPYIKSLVNQFIDEFEADGAVEFVREFAARLPGTVVCEEFGLPHADQPQFKTWTDAVIGLETPGNSEDREAELIEHLIAMFQYLERHLKDAATKQSGRIIHTLATMNKRDGTPFSFLERGWMLLTIFVGGNETTANMLATGMLKLATDPA